MNKSLIGVFAVFVLTSGAQAADLYQPDVVAGTRRGARSTGCDPVAGIFAETPVTTSCACAVRHYYTNDSTSQGDHDFATASIKNTGSIGGGVGYQYQQLSARRLDPGLRLSLELQRFDAGLLWCFLGLHIH